MSTQTKTAFGLTGALILVCTAAIIVTVAVIGSNSNGATAETGATLANPTLAPTQADLLSLKSVVKYRTQAVGDVEIFYREAGNPQDPTLLLLHGFPSSSHQFRDLIPLLSADFHIIAPDYPGFGSSVAPTDYVYTFDNLGNTMVDFVNAVDLNEFSMYIFDYGAPVGFRIALGMPQQVISIVNQNGNVYSDGFNMETWAPIMAYWNNSTQENRDALRGFLTLDTTTFQYVTGAPEDRLEMIGRDGILHDQSNLDRDNEIQLDLFLSYASNVEQYPAWQEYMRDFEPNVLAIWAKNDIFFTPAGAEAHKRDVPNVQIEFVDAGHFALETHAIEIAQSIRTFLLSNVF